VPRTCTICNHEKRADIDSALLNETPLREIARHYETSKDALARHREHLPKQLVKAQEQEDVRQAIDVVKQLKAINGATLAILKEARAEGNGELALKAVDRIQRQLELQAKLLGELQQEGTINVTVSPEWLTLRAVVIAALHPYPDAAQAVSRALTDGERP
jgi:DNA invertase Pin-like site-specific DNA recombinase